MIYILGENSFLAKNLYKLLKKENHKIFLLEHTNIDLLNNVENNDIIINFCGINRAETYEEYLNGNYVFVQNIINKIKIVNPFFIHISSLMVYGFKNKNIDDLVNYQKWFIQSKLAAETYLLNNYDNLKVSIIRPSNIFGYDTIPYYNNLLSTLVYEKIKGISKINKININCYRNMLSVNGFSKELLNILNERKSGIFNIMSNNNLSLNSILNIIYENNLPNYFSLVNNDEDVINIENNLKGDNIIINESLKEEIINLEKNMKIYLNLTENINIKKLNKLSDLRGDMVEISNLYSKRLYKITLKENTIRGNHYHFIQEEEFYINKGKVIFVLAYSDNIDVIYLLKLDENNIINIKPNIIHTLINDYNNNEAELFVVSTQEYIKNEIPDTKYVKLTI